MQLQNMFPEKKPIAEEEIDEEEEKKFEIIENLQKKQEI